MEVLLVSWGALIPLLTTELAWIHYFILTIPAALYFLRPVTDTGAAVSAGRSALRILTVVAMIMIGQEILQDLLHLSIADSVALMAGGALLLLALTALDALLYAEPPRPLEAAVQPPISNPNPPRPPE